MVLVGGLPMDARSARIDLHVVILLFACSSSPRTSPRRGSSSHRVHRADPRAIGALAAVRAGVHLRRDVGAAPQRHGVRPPDAAVVAVVVEAKLPRCRTCLALASASNVGGVVSFSGNPQT